MSQKTLFSILALVAVAFAIFFGVQTFKSEPSGVAIDAAGGLSNANLLAVLNDLVEDIQSVRSPLASLDTATTASITFPLIASSSNLGTRSTTTVVTGLVAAAGDFVIVSPATANPDLQFAATVYTASTTSATIKITAIHATSTDATPVASTFNLAVIPGSTFLVPKALITTTSTSF